MEEKRETYVLEKLLFVYRVGLTLTLNNKHLMTGLKGNSEFCFAETILTLRFSCKHGKFLTERRLELKTGGSDSGERCFARGNGISTRWSSLQRFTTKRHSLVQE